jgi:hypothetical protein
MLIDESLWVEIQLSSPVFLGFLNNLGYFDHLRDEKRKSGKEGYQSF